MSLPGGGWWRFFYSNGSKRVWSVCGHCADWLVVRLSEISIIKVLVPNGLHTCGQYSVANRELLLPGVGFSICKTAGRYCCLYHLMENQDPVPTALLVLLTACFSFDCNPPFPNLTTAWGKVMEAEWSLFPVIKEVGDTGRLLCSGAPQGPAQYQDCGQRVLTSCYRMNKFWRL